MINRGLAAIAISLVLMKPALAHAPIKGIGAFYNGLLHPLFVPSHLLVLIALGLLIGQHAPRASRSAWFGFVAGLSVAVAAASNLDIKPPQPVLLGVALAAGCLVILDRAFSAAALATVAVAGGIAIGLDSRPESASHRDFWLALLGSGIGSVLLVSYIGGIAAVLQRPWQRIGIRIAGSWTVACGVIVLAFAMANRTAVG